MTTNTEQPKFNVVIVEGLDKTIKKEIVYTAFKKFNVKWLAYNGKVCVATIEFASDAAAKEAMEAMNCKPILKKPIKMAIRSEKAAASALVEFSLSGLDQAADLNKVYRVTAKYGKSPKFGFNVSEKNKVYNRGYVSYLSITPEEVPQLIRDLAEVGVKCEAFDRKKPKKITVKIENFVEEFTDDSIQTRLTEATNLLKNVITKVTSYKEGDDYKILTRIPSSDKKENPVNSIVAYVSFDEMEKACNLHKYLRENKVPEFTSKKDLVVSFRVSENKETYTNIFTTGLRKPAGFSETQFKTELERSFKQAFKGVIQVNLTEKKRPNEPTAVPTEPEYMAFVTLATEENGKELIASYLDSAPKALIQKFYKKDPYFNIFCSANFRKDFKKAQLGHKRIEKQIKTQNDNMKKEEMEAKSRRNFEYPNQQRGRMMLPIPGMMPPVMPAGLPGMPPMAGLPGMPMAMFGPQGLVAPQGGLSGLPVGMPVPFGAPSLNPADIAQRRKDMIRDREANLKKDIGTLKRMVYPLIQLSVQDAGVPTGNSNTITGQIVMNVDDPKVLLDMVENPDLVKERVNNLGKK